MWMINQSTTVLFMTLVLYLLHKIKASPTKQVTLEVPFGETVTLVCGSNDEDHTFFFWFVGEKNIFVGPSYQYDNAKFKYEVLSGNLTVKAVSKDEEGVYNCVSRGVSKESVNIRSIRMIVKADWEDVYEHDPNVNIYRVVIVFGTLMVLSGVGYAGYKIWKNRFRHPAYLVPSEDDDDESGDEIFRAPGTSRGVENAAMPKTNSSESFSTDFKSILDTANKK
ncbi:uncharacterized protein LOC123009456 isoform X4 [Tribolium madens]|uniref:uncharacterized protein LOC123009456 isoform X4 n=1 Tax=Tribolium madens TaxID=41895 RepID=UPI001CF721A5|nr:uncharacterized protein LOC123009456 isoform X4 [Tribolium madens]